MDKLDQEILVTHLKTIREWGKPLTLETFELIVDEVQHFLEGDIQEQIEEAVYEAEREAADVAYRDGYDDGFAEQEWELDKIRDAAYEEGYEAAKAESEVVGV